MIGSLSDLRYLILTRYALSSPEDEIITGYLMALRDACEACSPEYARGLVSGAKKLEYGCACEPEALPVAFLDFAESAFNTAEEVEDNDKVAEGAAAEAEKRYKRLQAELADVANVADEYKREAELLRDAAGEGTDVAILFKVREIGEAVAALPELAKAQETAIGRDLSSMRVRIYELESALRRVEAQTAPKPRNPRKAKS